MITQDSTNHNQSLNSVSMNESLDTFAYKSVPEILAPVGGREQFFAALNSGADAVFLGLKEFNARSRAENFSTEDLRALVPLAHRYGMRVLVTVNVLIKDIELADLIRTLSELEDIGIDAIIVQDLGVASIAHKYFPNLRLHASTQMAVHNLAGVQKAWEWGFKRVVLARELTAQEIKRIRAAVPREMIELEVFCHGSLCYSYSGLCFFSGAADARSGNRGECAYTCREPYKVISEPGHGFLFSMKDLDTAHKLDLMIDAGVDTLKIEGRKKDAQYVSSVVKLYRRKLDDQFKRKTLRDSAPPLAHEAASSESAIRNDLQLSFQRKTTSFFFEGRYHENVIDLNNPTHNGVRAGVITGVRGRQIEVRLEAALERFDGVKIVAPGKVFHAKPQDGDENGADKSEMSRRYQNDEIAFSVRDLGMKGRWIAESHAGMLVEIKLDDNVRTPAVGDILFKTRSASLKRRVERLTGVPVDARLRPMRAVSAKVSAQTLDDGAMRVSADLVRLGEVVKSASILIAKPEIRSKGDLQSDLKDSLQVFGEEGIYVEEFVWELDQNWFVPRSMIKDLKKQLELDLESTCLAVTDRRRNLALAELCGTPESSENQETRTASYKIKIDRLEYLTSIEAALQSKIITDVSEVIFEPKKMYLTGIDSQEFLVPLKDFSERTGILVRFALPTVIRAWDEPVLRKWLKDARDQGFTSYEVANPGALAQLKSWDLPVNDLTSDFMLYAMNRKAVEFWREEGVHDICLSIEDDWTDLSSLLRAWPKGVTSTAILYKDTPLFVAESCSLTALHNGCPTAKVCGYRSLEIENSKGERFIVAHEGCKSIVYGKTAYSISGEAKKLIDAGVKYLRMDFLTRPYTADEMIAILVSIAGDKKIPATHPANFHGTLK